MTGKNIGDFPENPPEKYLHITWQHPEWLHLRLRTHCGLPLRVLSPGKPNPDNGPDFLNARLQIGREVHIGDVEIHRTPAEWFRHGHQRDSRYRQVILHVVWKAQPEIPPALSRRFPHLEISASLKIPPGQWLEEVRELFHEVPQKPAGIPGRISLTEAEKYAKWRFRRHLSEVKAVVGKEGWDNALWMGLAGVMGYRQNKDNFMLLFQRWPPERLYRLFHPLEISPVLFWMFWVWQAGLLGKSQAGPQISRLISRFPPPFMKAVQWHTSRLRPANLPWVRLAGLAQLAAAYPPGALFQKTEAVFAGRPAVSRLPSLLSEVFSPLLAENLKHHLKSRYGGNYGAIRVMGAQRRSQLLVNILLPLLAHYAAVRESWGYRAYLEEVYFSLPSIETVGWLKELIEQWHLPRRAAVEQGILEYLALHRLQAA